MEPDIKSLLDARAAALLRGVAKLPPIEQDLRRLRSTQAAPPHLVSCNPHCGFMNNMDMHHPHPQFGRSVITLHNRQPTFSVYPFPNRQQVHSAFNVNHQPLHRWPQPHPVRPSLSTPPKKVCEEIHLPSPTVDTKTPLGVLISSARSRTRRSSDYSAVSPRTRELTLYSLVETLLKQQQQRRETKKMSEDTSSEEEEESTPKQQLSSSALPMPSTRNASSGQHQHQPSMERSRLSCGFGPKRLANHKPLLIAAHSSSASTAVQLSPRECCARGTDVEHFASTMKLNCTSLCASRCSTADVGLSRASFWEDDDDEEYVDEQFTFVPRPPSHRKEASNRVCNLCEDTL